MTEKNFYAKQLELKSEIIEEIANLMQNKLRHDFKAKVYTHYIEGEVATTEVCESIEETGDGLSFHMDNGYISFVNDECKIKSYDAESLINIYDTLKKELKDETLDEMKKIISENGGNIRPSEKTMTYINLGTRVILGKVNNISVVSDSIIVNVSIPDQDVDCDESNFDIEDLRNLLYFVKKATEKTWSIKAEAVYSRTFDVKAESWEKACEIVKEALDKEPLCEDDSNGVQFF